MRFDGNIQNHIPGMSGIETYVLFHDKSIGKVHLALKHVHVVLIWTKAYFGTKNAGAIGRKFEFLPYFVSKFTCFAQYIAWEAPFIPKIRKLNMVEFTNMKTSLKNTILVQKFGIAENGEKINFYWNLIFYLAFSLNRTHLA